MQVEPTTLKTAAGLCFIVLWNQRPWQIASVQGRFDMECTAVHRNQSFIFEIFDTHNFCHETDDIG